MSFNEQKVLFDFEDEFCERIEPFLKDLGIWDNRLEDARRLGTDKSFPHVWRLSHNWNKDKRKRTEIKFKAVSYGDSKREYGETQEFPLPDRNAGWRRRYEPTTVDIHEEIRESFTVMETSESSYDYAVDFNVTNRTWAKAEAKAEVGGVGGSAEAGTETTTSLSTHFGGGHSESQTKEITKQSNTTLSVKVGQVVVAKAVIKGVREVRPFTESAILDFELLFNLYDWLGHKGYLTNKKRSGNWVWCANIQDLIWLIEGQRVAEYPGMRGFLDGASLRHTQVFEVVKK